MISLSSAKDFYEYQAQHSATHVSGFVEFATKDELQGRRIDTPHPSYQEGLAELIELVDAALRLGDPGGLDDLYASLKIDLAVFYRIDRNTPTTQIDRCRGRLEKQIKRLEIELQSRGGVFPIYQRPIAPALDNRNSLLIGVGTILDSEAFLKSLILGKGAFKRMVVLEWSIENMYMSLGERSRSIRDFRDADALRPIEEFEPPPSQFANNVFLSHQLFLWATREGLLNVVSVPESDFVTGSTSDELLSRVGIDVQPTREVNLSSRTGPVWICPNWPGVSSLEAIYAYLEYASFTSRDILFGDALRTPSSVKSFIQESSDLWNPRSYLDYFKAVENPNYLSELACRIREAHEARRLNRDLVLFAPRAIADWATGGIFSFCELLIRVIRRHLGAGPRDAP